MFFTKTDSKCCNHLKEILLEYELASGQTINKEKSAITFSAKSPSELKIRVKGCIGIEKERGSGKYLGLPELFGRKKKDLFTSIVDRIKEKSLSWSTRRLSTAGKLVMLKAVLMALPTYTFMSFKVSKSLCKRIQSALTRFWWDSNLEKKSMCWIAWDKMTKSKRDGGLGFRNIEALNDALLAKDSWRILCNPDCLLAKLLLGKYCGRESFLEVEAGSTISHGWRGILLGRDVLKQGLSFIIGDGKSTRIWDDPWLSVEKPERPYGPATEGTKDWTVSKLFHHGTKEWNTDLIRELLPEREADIMKIKQSQHGAKDRLVWTDGHCGQFSTKKAYYLVIDQMEESFENDGQAQEFEWNKFIWSLRSLPKIQMMLWKAMKWAIPVADNLARRKVITDDKCKRCGATEKTEHVLLHCPYAKEVWAMIPFKDAVDSKRWETLGDGLRKIKGLKALPPTGVDGETLATSALWNIWNSRNKLVFEERWIEPEEVCLQAMREAREWHLAQEEERKEVEAGEKIRTEQYRNRDEGEEDLIRICTDAAWDKQSRVAGIGWTMDIRREKLHMHSTGYRTRNEVKSVSMAEALACLEALKHIRAINQNKVMVSSDSLNLIRALSKKEYPLEVYGVLSDIEMIKRDFKAVYFNYIPRKENSEADGLAKMALCLEREGVRDELCILVS